MDNNFYKILETFKRLNEGSFKDFLWDHAESMDREQFIDYTTGEIGQDPEEMAAFWDSINGEIDETFTGYWKGNDAGTPGKKMVGGTDECREEPVSLADKLKARWEETKRAKGLDEAGANNPAQGTITSSNPVDAAKAAQELTVAQQNLNKLKSAGVNLPTSVGQAAKSAITTVANPNAATGQGMDQTAKKTAMGLGQEMEKLMTTGDPGQVQQVATAIKQTKLGQQ